MSTISSEQTVEVLRSLFARYGLPHILISDNGAQFTSDTFSRFCKRNGIHHKLSAPYHPSTNGETERFVQTFKSSMMAKQNNLQTALALCQFLLKYRSSPHSITGKTPASMMFNREIRTRLSLLLPNQTESNEAEEEEGQDKVHTFEIDDPVWARVYSGKNKWIPGEIVEKFGPCNYKV